MPSKTPEEYAIMIRAISEIARPRLSIHDHDGREDEDGCIELTIMSDVNCIDGSETQEEIRVDRERVLAALDIEGVHVVSCSDPVWKGYSEYTPDPGDCMRVKLLIDDQIDPLLRMAYRLFDENEERRKWSRLAYDYKQELDIYQQGTCTYLDHDCDDSLCKVARNAYLTNSDLYDLKPDQFPKGRATPLATVFKVMYPQKAIEDLCLRAHPVLSALAKGIQK